MKANLKNLDFFFFLRSQNIFNLMKISKSLHGFPTPDNSDVSHLFQSLSFILIVKGLIGTGQKIKNIKLKKKSEFLCCVFNLPGLYLLRFDSAKNISLSSKISHSLSASSAAFVSY